MAFARFPLRSRREVLNQEQFDRLYGFRQVDLSLLSRLFDGFSAMRRWRSHQWWKWVKSRIPIFDWISTYKRSYIFYDIMAGLIIGVFNIPQGLAFGLLADVPPIYGLFTSIYPPIIYALLGTSRHVSPGCTAILTLMVAGSIQRHFNPGESSNSKCNFVICDVMSGADNSTDLDTVQGRDAIQYAMALTFYVGIIQLFFGLINLGILAVWLSDQMVQGLTTGAAFHIFTSQITYATGIKNLPRTTQPFGIVTTYICLFSRIKETQLLPLVITLVCILLLLICRELLDPLLENVIRIKIPIELSLVIFGTLASSLGNFKNHGLAVIGHVPNKLEAPNVSNYLSDLHELFHDAIAIAVVGFAIEVSIAKLISKKEDYEIDANQEWLALGFMNSIASFFACIPGGVSLSRTMVQVQMGAKTQLATLVSAVIVLIVVLTLAQYLTDLPKCVLAAIIMFALRSLFLQLCKLGPLFEKSSIDFLIWMVTFGSVVLLNVTLGLVIGICFALLTVIFRSQLAESTCLGNVADTGDFKAVRAYRDAKEISGIKVYRFDAPLFFANAELFLDELHKKTGVDPVIIRDRMKELEAANKGKTKVKSSVSEFNLAKHGLHHIIIDCSSFPYIDLMATEALSDAYHQYDLIGIRVYYAACKTAVRQMFERSGFYDQVPKKYLFVNVRDAVTAALTEAKLFP